MVLVKVSDSENAISGTLKQHYNSLESHEYNFPCASSRTCKIHSKHYTGYLSTGIKKHSLYLGKLALNYVLLKVYA